uniref:Uncharacterized protein n=1 Tax=Anopheles quadriannulatus TaxID=34691 RepID=A0A182XSW6_ANOQN
MAVVVVVVVEEAEAVVVLSILRAQRCWQQLHCCCGRWSGAVPAVSGRAAPTADGGGGGGRPVRPGRGSSPADGSRNSRSDCPSGTGRTMGRGRAFAPSPATSRHGGGGGGSPVRRHCCATCCSASSARSAAGRGRSRRRSCRAMCCQSRNRPSWTQPPRQQADRPRAVPHSRMAAAR